MEGNMTSIRRRIYLPLFVLGIFLMLTTPSIAQVYNVGVFDIYTRTVNGGAPAMIIEITPFYTDAPDFKPWIEVIDSLSLNCKNPSNIEYGPVTFNPNFDKRHRQVIQLQDIDNNGAIEMNPNEFSNYVWNVGEYNIEITNSSQASGIFINGSGHSAGDYTGEITFTNGEKFTINKSVDEPGAPGDWPPVENLSAQMDRSTAEMAVKWTKKSHTYPGDPIYDIRINLYKDGISKNFMFRVKNWHIDSTEFVFPKRMFYDIIWGLGRVELSIEVRVRNRDWNQCYTVSSAVKYYSLNIDNLSIEEIGQILPRKKAVVVPLF